MRGTPRHETRIHTHEHVHTHTERKKKYIRVIRDATKESHTEGKERTTITKTRRRENIVSNYLEVEVEGRKYDRESTRANKKIRSKKRNDRRASLVIIITTIIK